MPKKATEKNTKGSKNNVTKKTVSKKVEVKKEAPKKVESKKETPKKEEVKKETVKVMKKEKKGKFKNLINEITKNTPFAISLCAIVILIAALVLVLFMKRIPKTSDGKEIVATINGKKFTADELYENLKESAGTTSLLELVDSYIAEKEVTVTDEDKDYVKEVVDYYKEYADYYGVDLKTFLSSYMGLSGIETEDEFSDFVLNDYKKTLAVRKFIGDNAEEDDLKEYYKENYSDTITAKHILIEIDKDAEDADKADKEAYEKAVDLIDELNDTSSKKLTSKFEKLAKENSDDTATYSNGGLIEDFSKTSVEEAFYNAASKLKDGEYTKEPVKTSYGYHIILKVSSTPVKDYKDIKDDVRKKYAESLLSSDNTLQTLKWDELRKQYKFSIKDDFLKKIYNDSIDAVKDSKKDSKDDEE